MVWVTVHFAAEGERWTHDFEVPQDAQVRELKATMLNPPGTDEDIDSFELRLLGRRVPDFEKITQDCDLDFEFLGPVEGERKARRDKADEPHWAALQLPQQEPPFRDKSLMKAPMKPKTSSVEVAVEAIRAQPAKRPPHATEKGPMSPVKRWEVIGGADKGGILVREGQSTTSKQLAERLSTGAFVEELDLRGERLNYKRLTGTGPEIGWVSLTVSGKEIVKPSPMSPEEMLTFSCALSLQEELMEGFGKPEFQKALAKIIQEHPSKTGSEFMRKRNELFLTVQSIVLPRYGFEGSPKGVVQMMKAFAPHGHMPEVGWNNDQLNKLLQM
ncbi:Uncharacterized protein SCF082_LOCUS17781 [Durusdinium trenchii]|uniref:Protein C10 n=1 Tax=Durusdinium trenchii TaxID=1381693 RepID=A0ABP0KJV8_9DINO